MCSLSAGQVEFLHCNLDCETCLCAYLLTSVKYVNFLLRVYFQCRHKELFVTLYSSLPNSPLGYILFLTGFSSNETKAKAGYWNYFCSW